MAEYDELFPAGPEPVELKRLGLQDVKFLIPTQHVQAQVGVTDSGENKVVIYLKDITILSVDPVTNQIAYRTDGLRQYVQTWDVGGAYLDPDILSREFKQPPESDD